MPYRRRRKCKKSYETPVTTVSGNAVTTGAWLSRIKPETARVKIQSILGGSINAQQSTTDTKRLSLGHSFSGSGRRRQGHRFLPTCIWRQRDHANGHSKWEGLAC